MNAIRSKSFNPFQYATSNLYETTAPNSENNTEQFDDMISKAGKKVFKVDIGHFDKLCRYFKDKCDLKIKNLSGNDKEDFKLMVSYVRLLYGTKYYDHIHKKIIKYFSDLDGVKPGTIGGYFGGCLVNTSFESQPGCSAVCAGSVPRPADDEGWSFCDQSVVFAEGNYNSDGKFQYTFSVLKDGGNPNNDEPWYIFIEHTNLHDFAGFSKQEKDELKEMGIKNLYLVGCDDSGKKYVDLYQGMVRLRNVKHRKIDYSNNSGLGLGMVLVVIFLLLVAVFFGWRFWDKNYDPLNN